MVGGAKVSSVNGKLFINAKISPRYLLNYANQRNARHFRCGRDARYEKSLQRLLDLSQYQVELNPLHQK